MIKEDGINLAEKIIETVREPMLVLDMDLRVQSANESFYRNFQVEQDETVGRLVYELGNGQWNIPALAELLENVLPQNKVFNDFEIRHDFENLGQRTMLLNARQIDHVPLILLAIEDVTERQRAEEVERASQAQLQILFDAAPLGMYLVDADFRIRQVNPTARPLFGDIPDLIGRDFDQVIHQLWPWEYAHKLVKLFRHTLETGEPSFVPEWIEERLDRGLIEYYEWQINRIPLPEGRYGLVCYFRDISAQVLARQAIARSEEKYRTLFESIDEGFCIIEVLFDENGKAFDYRFLEANPAFEKQTGLVDAMGKTIRELVPQHEAHWFEIYGQIALTGVPARFEDPAVALGRFYDVYAFRVDAPEQRRVAVLFSDIKERKQAEAQLKGWLQQKEILLKEINHRVKNNLQAINNLLYMQAATISDQPTRQLLQAAQDRIKAIALIHEKLYQSENLAHIDLADYLTNLTKQVLYSHRSDPGSIELQLEVDEARLDVDTAVPLGIIVNELVSNALKHAFPQGRSRLPGQPDKLEISLQVDGEGRYLLTVRDNGVGLPEGLDLKQVPSLGLRLVEMLTGHMGGEVNVERNGGTAFKIRFSSSGIK